MKHIIITSNSPRSGKDAAALSIKSQFSYLNPTWITMAYPLYETIPILFGICPVDWMKMYSQDKDTPSDRLKGKSPRQALQWLAEDVMKPTYGVAHFGELAAHRALQKSYEGYGLSIVSDGGFVAEVDAYVSIVGRENCAIINVIRYQEDGDDTRVMVRGEDVGVTNYTLYNTESLYHLYDSLNAIVLSIIKDTA